MNITHPTYYRDFECTASDCSDNCCIGWEIDIDKEALKRYEKADSENLLSIMEHIDTNGKEAHFVLGEDGRCPFLDEKNLCNIYKTLGEQALCRICTLHPRFINEYGDTVEYGLDLCCEEAVRLTLSQSQFTLTTQESSESITELSADTALESSEELAFFQALKQCRETLFSYIANKEIPLTDMMNHLLFYGESIDDLIFDQNFDTMPDIDIQTLSETELSSPFFTRDGIAKCLAFLRTLTPLSVSWHNFLADVERDLDTILAQADDFLEDFPKFDHHARLLLCHYIYHYFLTGLWEDEVYSKIFFAVFMVRMTWIFDVAHWYYHETFTFHDQVDICCQFSKEIEYCRENLEQVLDFSYLCQEE